MGHSCKAMCLWHLDIPDLHVGYKNNAGAIVGNNYLYQISIVITLYLAFSVEHIIIGIGITITTKIY